MKNMNRREGKKIAVMAAIIMGLMMFAFMPLASATVTSFTVTPSTGIAGAVDSYNALVTTDGVTTINITIPAGFIGVVPMSGGVEIARIDFWNSSTKAYYGYATFTANDTNPTTKIDAYCDLGGVTACTTQDVDYTPGATNTFVSHVGGDESSVKTKLPTETVNGSINITINCTAFYLDDVMFAIKQFVRNPTTAGNYDFKAEDTIAQVYIKSKKGSGSGIFRKGLWFIDKTGNQKTDIYFLYGTEGDLPVVGNFGTFSGYGVYRVNALNQGWWYIDTTGNQQTNQHFWYGTIGDIPVNGNFGTFSGYGVYRVNALNQGWWYIDTTGNQQTNQHFWYGTAGDIPVVGEFNGQNGYGVYRVNALNQGWWYIDTDFDQKPDLRFWYGTTGDVPVVGDFDQDGTGDYGVYRVNALNQGWWYIDTNFDQKTNQCYWYGTTGDKPFFGGDIG